VSTTIATDLYKRAAALHATATVIDTQGVGVLLPHVHLPQPPFEGKSHLDRCIAAAPTRSAASPARPSMPRVWSAWSFCPM
jgi:hypothetical protein